MSQAARSPAPTLHVVLSDEQLDELAARVARKLLESSTDDTYDQDHLPQGLSRRVYLDAARKGAFATRRLGRRIVAKREDVEAWATARAHAARAPKPGPVVAVDPTLAAIIAANRARVD